MFFMSSSCKDTVSNEQQYPARIDVRLGFKYYSVFLSKENKAYVIKGKGSFYTDSLIVKSSDTSHIFKLDSVRLVLESFDQIKSSPITRTNRTGTAQRIEIYYEHKKIYDGYAWDEVFWNLYRPIMKQLPKGFDPFRVDDKPFDM